MAPRIAGAVVLVDGLLSLAAAAMFLLLTMFPPVAAIEGRPPVEQSWGLQALASLVLAIAGLWAGQRALRGIQRGHVAGAAVAASIGMLLGWFAVTGDAGSAGGTAIWTGIAVVHLVAALALWRWRAPEHPVAGAATEAASS